MKKSKFGVKKNHFTRRTLSFSEFFFFISLNVFSVSIQKIIHELMLLTITSHHSTSHKNNLRNVHLLGLAIIFGNLMAVSTGIVILKGYLCFVF